MIRIDFAAALALFLFVPLVLVFGGWVFYNLNGRKEEDWETEYFQQCPYCAYIFFYYGKQALMTCPRCRSLTNVREKEKGLMKPIAPKLNNESGVILLTVILITMVMAVTALSVMTLSVSQTKSAYQVAQSVKSEQLAQGAFYQYYQRTLEGTGTAPYSETLDGKYFSVYTSSLGTTSSPNGTDKINITVTTN